MIISFWSVSMELIHCFLVYLALESIVSWPEVRAQTPNTSITAARLLDALLQDYAYRAFVHPRTSVVFDAQVPANFSGIKLAAMRVRSGNLRSRGVENYKEFRIPIGVIEQTYVVRLVLVYQNLGNWSSIYYSIPGYTFLAPVLGLLAYDAANLSATNLPEIDIKASKKPISIQFTDVRMVPTGLSPKCVWFDLQGLVVFSNLTLSNTCSTYRQGHFSIVVESTVPAPAPVAPPNHGPVSPGSTPSGGAKKDKLLVWKIASLVVGGSAVLVLLALLVVWLQRYRRKKKMEEMEQQAEIGEALQMTSIGNTRAPMAMGTRAPPILENEYVP